MAVVKRVGSSGQIALGKQYAGRDVLVDETEPGVWVIKVGRFVPENEKWLHGPNTKAALDRAIQWAERNPPSETDLDELEARLKG